MRVALLGDVHTNIAALAAIIQDVRQCHVDDVWGLGDWVGYHTTYLPWLVWEKLQDPMFGRFCESPQTHGVIGNHDIAVCHGIPENQNYREDARSAIVKQRQQVENLKVWKDEFLPWLQHQPHMLSPLSGIYLAHGTFWLTDIEQMPFYYPGRTVSYEVSFQSLRQGITPGSHLSSEQRVCAVDGWKAPVILITGHSHLQGLWQRDPANPQLGGDWPLVQGSQIHHEEIDAAVKNRCRLIKDCTVRVTVEQPLWINPGSVGQRRDVRTPVPDGCDWARYAILEWLPEESSAVVSLRWVPYATEGHG